MKGESFQKRYDISPIDTTEIEVSETESVLEAEKVLSTTLEQGSSLIGAYTNSETDTTIDTQQLLPFIEEDDDIDDIFDKAALSSPVEYIQVEVWENQRY